ncbi:class I adenylate-forming enzyme family protein [Nocardia terpenica]|uniref:AMP-binding protein n=1 Tax=Nocardia terpenica TaxID=455432 RepID=A0A6G9YX32_9NOCA|nr:AMP-binding protein [Nocardia terpenica]QIS17730.1 AMP-binding protein [Nocardia terpenica]
MTHDNRATETTVATLIAARAAERPAHPFLADARSERTLSYAAAAAAMDTWSRYLDAHSVPPGARVVLDTADPLTFASVYLALLATGRCAIPVDPNAPLAERRRTLAPLEPVAVVSDRTDLAHAFDPALPMIPACFWPESSARSRPKARRDQEGASRDQEGASRDQEGASRDQEGASREGGSVILATSGSTGAPKAMRLTEKQLLHVARAVAEHNKLGPSDRGYNCLPLFHINAEVVALLATLEAGACLVLDRRFHATGFWELLAGKGITWLNAVPAILGVLTSERAAPLAVPAGLRFIRSASAPLPAAVRARLEAAADIPIVESYGMTEAASQITATDLDTPAPRGSCGRPVAVQMQIRDDLGRPVPPGIVGRVHIRGTAVVGGYLGGRAAECFDAAGWLDTGDLGHRDTEGYLYLAGRADDVINRGGELLYPREIEEVLVADPGVRDAVVVGRADPILGSVPVAFVVPAHRPGTDRERANLLRGLRYRCDGQLSRIKRPVEFLVVEDFPRAATGKVQRHRLRSAVA